MYKLGQTIGIAVAIAVVMVATSNILMQAILLLMIIKPMQHVATR